MKPENHCRHCRRLLNRIRNPKQHYCSDLICQKFRKNHWRREKRSHDVDYRANQRKANQRWRAAHKDYWQHYRTTHPDYVSRNRKKQRCRDCADPQREVGESDVSHLANSDALSAENPIKPGTYRLIRLGCDSLANSDAYTVKIDVITRSYPIMNDLAKRPPYSQSD